MTLERHIMQCGQLRAATGLLSRRGRIMFRITHHHDLLSTAIDDNVVFGGGAPCGE